jgi:hypothetical protein
MADDASTVQAANLERLQAGLSEATAHLQGVIASVNVSPSQ